MRPLLALFAFALCLSLAHSSMAASTDKQKYVIAVCGPMRGMSYYMDPGKHGWQKENGVPLKLVFSREQQDEGDYQITFVPPSGKRYDLRDEGGGNISVIDNRTLGTITFIVTYSSTLQPTVYHLRVNDEGKGEMIMTQLKSNPTTQHMSLLQASCGNL